MNWLSLSSYEKARFPNPKRIKDLRREMPRSCQQCNKAENPKCRFHVCAKCKEVPYCSRECQKAHWPVHKSSCAPPTGLVTDFPRFCQTLIANDFLLFCFEMLLVNEFDLVNKQWHPGSEPLKAEIMLDFEPCDMADLRSLFDPKAKIDSRSMQGMLQVCIVVSKNSIDSLSVNNYPIAKYAEEFGVGESSPYVSVTFLRCADGQIQGTTSAVVIRKQAIEACREMKQIAVPAPLGFEEDSILLPMSAFACIELINGLIQHDTANEWLLRMNMLEKDKEAIKDAASGRPGQTLRMIVKNKILERINVAENGKYT